MSVAPGALIEGDALHLQDISTPPTNSHDPEVKAGAVGSTVCMIGFNVNEIYRVDDGYREGADYHAGESGDCGCEYIIPTGRGHVCPA